MFTQKITPAARELLSSLIGQEFRSVGGVNLSKHLVCDNLIIETARKSLFIFGDIEEDALGPGSCDDFSFFVIETASVEEIDSVQHSGNSYLQDKRSLIKDVSVIREQISLTVGGVTRWELTWDSGVILHLDEGCVTVCFQSLSQEALRIDYLDSFVLEDLPVPSTSYEDSLSSECTRKRAIVSSLKA